MFNKPSDSELVAALRNGSSDALTEIFSRYWKILYLSAFSKLKSHELAEEVVQDLFADLWEKRERLCGQENTNLAAYLHRAVKNRVLNAIRKIIYDQKYWEHCKEAMPATPARTESLAEFNELQDKLQEAINDLSGKTREIFVLHKLEGVPVGKISRQLNLSEKAVGYHLTKSVKKLKIQLRDFTT